MNMNTANMIKTLILKPIRRSYKLIYKKLRYSWVYSRCSIIFLPCFPNQPVFSFRLEPLVFPQDSSAKHQAHGGLFEAVLAKTSGLSGPTSEAHKAKILKKQYKTWKKSEAFEAFAQKSHAFKAHPRSSCWTPRICFKHHCLQMSHMHLSRKMPSGSFFSPWSKPSGRMWSQSLPSCTSCWLDASTKKRGTLNGPSTTRLRLGQCRTSQDSFWINRPKILPLAPINGPSFSEFAHKLPLPTLPIQRCDQNYKPKSLRAKEANHGKTPGSSLNELVRLLVLDPSIHPRRSSLAPDTFVPPASRSTSHAVASKIGHPRCLSSG